MGLLTQIWRSAVVVVLLTVFAYQVAAQVPGVGSKILGAPQQEQTKDPLGRTTPRQAITAFVRAVDRDDLVSAARYMQVTESQRRDTETLARDLKALMDPSITATRSRSIIRLAVRSPFKAGTKTSFSSISTNQAKKKSMAKQAKWLRT